MKKLHKKNYIFHSINIRIALCMFLSIAIALIINAMISMYGFMDGMTNLLYDSMISFIRPYASLIHMKLETSGENSLQTQDLTELLLDAKIEGSKSSYVYLTDSNGTMLYHPTTSKIGTSVENTVIKDVISKLSSGNVKKTDVVNYLFNDVEKYACYTILDNNWILVLSVDQDDIFADYYTVRSRSITSCIFLILLFGIVGFLIAYTISHPLKRLTKCIHQIADFDLRENKTLEHLRKRKDETGTMAFAISNMQESLSQMVMNIEKTSGSLEENAKKLNGITDTVHEHSADNSATSEELAAEMEETSAATEMITENIHLILQNSQELTEHTAAGQNTASTIMEKAAHLKDTSLSAREHTQYIYASVRDKTAVAIEQSKKVNKINALTDSIMSIAKQTSLLSLNASIEAARAGEAGKGFSVVASEISDLAGQSSNAVKGISQIVAEVHKAVESMSDCLDTTLQFLEQTVLIDYNKFIDVSTQYAMDANYFETTMKSMHEALFDLTTTTNQISDAISDINTTITDAATGVNDIAQKTSDIESLADKTHHMVEETVRYADSLRADMSKFNLS